MKKIRILMNGPGYGHNMHLWIKYFGQNNNKYDVTFISESEYKFEKYNNIKILLYRNKYDLFKILIFALFSRKYTIFFLHDASSVKSSILYLLFFHFNKSCLMVWGYEVINTLIYSKNKKAKFLYKLLFYIVDNICVSYSIKCLIVDNFKKIEKKMRVYYWGIEKEFIEDSKKEISTFTKIYLENIHDDDIFVFWPRSIIKISRFDLLIEALNKIKTSQINTIKNVKIIIWHGNVIDSNYKNYLLGMIKKYDLNNFIKIAEHPYLPLSDIKALWKRCDFSINIIENDNFSTQLSEAFLTKKPILLSKIPAYTIIDKKFNLSLDFVNIEIDEIADKFIYFINNYKMYNPVFLENRSIFCKSHLCFEDNIVNLIESIENNELTKFDKM